MIAPRTVSKALNSFMPSMFDTNDNVYKALISDEDSDGGAMAIALRETSEFIDYYSRTNNVDDAQGSLIDSISALFSTIERHYSEPDSNLRTRYKALVERNHNQSWGSTSAIIDILSYFFTRSRIYLVENYPVVNLVLNGGFGTLDGWLGDVAHTEFRIVYSKSFEGGAALYINPGTAGVSGSIEQGLSGCSDGIYSILFFISSPKKGPGDIEYEIQDGAGRYWDVASSAWTSSRVSNYASVDDPTAGVYKKIQADVVLSSLSDIHIRFRNRNGNGVLVDGVRFGRIDYPAIRVYVVADPEVFHDSLILYNNTLNHNGFLKYYFAYDIEHFIMRAKPAGVSAEFSMLASRLNIPWDRISISWMSSIYGNTLLLHDGTIRHAYGGVSFRTIGHDLAIAHDGTYLFDGLMMERVTPAGSVLYGSQNSRNATSQHKTYRERLIRQILHDERTMHDARFDHSGIRYGIDIGLSRATVTTNRIVSHNGACAHDGMMRHDALIKYDGIYVYFQSETNSFVI